MLDESVGAEATAATAGLLLCCCSAAGHAGALPAGNQRINQNNVNRFDTAGCMLTATATSFGGQVLLSATGYHTVESST
jgi:hypothetical protein